MGKVRVNESIHVIFTSVTAQLHIAMATSILSKQQCKQMITA